MTYTTPVLTEAMRVSGAPIADLYATTTGTDGDFVVKVIDVYPAENANDPKMGGYQLPISLDIFRGRYRDSFPLYDRNPQTYVPNIFFAKPTDYKKATVTLKRGGATPSAVLLPVVPVAQAQAK
jgi:predicted acyl esterase